MLILVPGPHPHPEASPPSGSPHEGPVVAFLTPHSISTEAIKPLATHGAGCPGNWSTAWEKPSALGDRPRQAQGSLEVDGGSGDGWKSRK